jgi:uncharacterized DUF497 family protein
MSEMRFEWDDEKDKLNQKTHGGLPLDSLVVFFLWFLLNEVKTP